MEMLTDLIEPVLSIGRKAGAEILKIYGSDFAVETKADDSPLTAADEASHKLIVESLAKLTPEIPVWSEESATISFEERSQWPEFWLVDPLDGTKEFIKRNGEFTVNIALIRNHEPVLGVVHVPVTGRDYFGYQGGGAFCADAGGPAVATSRASFSSATAPSEPGMTGSPTARIFSLASDLLPISAIVPGAGPIQRRSQDSQTSANSAFSARKP